MDPSDFFVNLRNKPITSLAWLPVWLFALFGGALTYHVVVGIASDGNGNVPGWYLHVMMPWTAFAFGLGVVTIWGNRLGRMLLGLLVIYALIYHCMVFWSQLALFGGCAIKDEEKYYVFSGNFFCFDQLGQVVERIAVMGWPGLGLVGLMGTGLSLFLILRNLKLSIQNSRQMAKG